MFEMEEHRVCRNCKWWEKEYIKNHRTGLVAYGTCQCYDERKPEYKQCCRHQFEGEVKEKPLW